MNNSAVRFWLEKANEDHVFDSNSANDASQAFLAILDIIHDVHSGWNEDIQGANCQCPSHQLFFIEKSTQ